MTLTITTYNRRPIIATLTSTMIEMQCNKIYVERLAQVRRFELANLIFQK